LGITTAPTHNQEDDHLARPTFCNCLESNQQGEPGMAKARVALVR
jgi:hypothetical protein